MPVSNAQRQRAYIARLKAGAGATDPAVTDMAETVEALGATAVMQAARVEALRLRVADLEALVDRVAALEAAISALRPVAAPPAAPAPVDDVPPPEQVEAAPATRRGRGRGRKVQPPDAACIPPPATQP